ncbi:MAG: glycosyltransferase family 9 protein [Proteobacteria bacterium]|nr:glycosyltransferase family 9 protein [Pseudomonadota bacterium]
MIPKSICIFRLSAIGDTTHVIPVVKSLQNHFPNIEISWVIGAMEHKLLAGLPGVNFIVFHKSTGLKGMFDLRKILKGQCFDVLLHMQYSFRANVLAFFIKAKRRIGFDKKRSRELHGLVVNERIAFKKNIHVLDGFMQFADCLGVKSPVYDWQIPVSASDQKFAENLIDSQKPTVVISPCSSQLMRNWKISRYAKITDYLVEKYQAQVILTGSPAKAELETVAQIEAVCEHPVLNIAGKDTLKQLLCLFQQADLVISPDSGPLHMAGSVNTPVIGLAAATNCKRSGSYQFPQLTVNCYPEACVKFHGQTEEQLKWGAKNELPGAMDLVTVEAVIKKIELANKLYKWSDATKHK